jgi:hypothetical protein
MLMLSLSLLWLIGCDLKDEPSDVSFTENQKVDSLFLLGKAQGTLTNPLLEEVSGLVLSQRYPNRMYLHTDSGGEAAVYVIDTLGNELGKIDLPGIKNRDWEDIALGQGPNGISYLYLADVGDNDGKYDEIYLLRFPEPELIQPLLSASIEQAVLNYVGGPRDAETLLADPISGDLFLVSKRESKSALYQVPLSAFQGVKQSLQKIYEFDFTGAVGGDVSKDGSQVLIKTYFQVFYWQRDMGQTLLQALQGPAIRLPYTPEPQGEAIGFNYFGNAYFTLSEKRNGVLPVLYRYVKNERYKK